MHMFFAVHDGQQGSTWDIAVRWWSVEFDVSSEYRSICPRIEWGNSLEFWAKPSRSPWPKHFPL